MSSEYIHCWNDTTNDIFLVHNCTFHPFTSRFSIENCIAIIRYDFYWIDQLCYMTIVTTIVIYYFWRKMINSAVVDKGYTNYILYLTKHPSILIIIMCWWKIENTGNLIIQLCILWIWGWAIICYDCPVWNSTSWYT